MPALTAVPIKAQPEVKSKSELINSKLQILLNMKPHLDILTPRHRRISKLVHDGRDGESRL
jgi:hypothetical protein